jgi:hypothetical protein
MDVLKTALALTLIAGAAQARAVSSQDGEAPDPRAKVIAAQAKELCNSTDEYIKTLTWLRTTKEFIVPEKTARLTAERVARGCDGAAERFEKVLLLMKTAGLSDPKSLEIALRFSGYSPDVQKNFVEIFTRAYLGEFFDYDYNTAVALALELSKDYHGEPAAVRDDFIYLSQLCKDGKGIDLPVKTCAEYAIKVARLSQYYPDGIRKNFSSLYKKLREDRDFGMDIKTALEVTYNILKNGPRAHDNFMNAYAFAMKDAGLGLGRSQALEFALKMAAHSFSGDEPPVVPSAASLTNAANN